MTPPDAVGEAGPRDPFRLGDRVPTGWYLLGSHAELAPGTVTPWSAHGVELVVWADGSGAVHAADAHCPHMGAHLGHGGCVDDQSGLVCPFHGWVYAPDGTNRGERAGVAGVDLALHPVQRVRDRWYVFLRHDPAGASPPWAPADLHRPPRPDPPRLEVGRVHHLTAHQQVIIEGDFDLAHFPVVHHRGFRGDDVEFGDHGARVAYTVTEPSPQTVRFELDGISRVREQVAYDGIEILLVADSVSLDRHRTRTVATMAVWGPSDEAVRAVAARIDRLLRRDLARDAAIWERRHYEQAPVYGPDDGLLVQFRRWARRFYA